MCAWSLISEVYRWLGWKFAKVISNGWFIQSSDQRAILASSTALLRYSSNSTVRSEASLFSWYFCTVASHRFQRPFSSWEPNHFSKTETQKIGFNPNKDSISSLVLDSNFRTLSIQFICWVQERCFSKNAEGLTWNVVWVLSTSSSIDVFSRHSGTNLIPKRTESLINYWSVFQFCSQPHRFGLAFLNQSEFAEKSLEVIYQWSTVISIKQFTKTQTTW